MKQKAIWTLALLCTTAQGLWAQATVKSEQELNDAIDYYTRITLDADIKLEKSLLIRATTWTTIDLNGHKLYRSLSEYDLIGHVITIENGGALALKSSAEGGSIEGGRATYGGGIMVYANCSLTVEGVKFTNNSASNHGGAIFAQSGSNLTLSNATFIGNAAGDHAGAIWNNGTLTATDCTFTDNTASDVGGIYNSVTVDGVGKATLTSCTFTENEGTAGAGALANALGATEMTIEDCTIEGNIASGHGGGIWNGGTLTVTNSTFTNNTANDVGGIYNATDGTIAGTATLTGCTFTGNTGTAGAGALANAMGNTVMTINGGTIENNTAYEYGAGIWNGGTLNMKGKITVKDNKNDYGMFSNVYLKNENVITVTGSLTGSRIGVEMESVSGTFTSGYNTHHNGANPSNFFTADRSSIVNLELASDGEASLSSTGSVYYIERSWDATNKEVVSTQKRLIGAMIGHNATPVEGQYKDVTNAPDNNPDEWFGMGGFSDDVPEFYVVRGNVNRETIVVQGRNVHLILCDGVTLTLTGGLKLEGDFKLYIHCQSYGDNMGRLIVTNKYQYAAGIGSAQHNGDGVKVGELVIYGGHIEATGGKQGAGIGSCGKNGDNKQLSNKVTIYGGFVRAQGGEYGAGIGGGSRVHGGDFILYDGTVIANGGNSVQKIGGNEPPLYGAVEDDLGGGAGVGGGGNADKDGGHGGNVTVYGGSLTATGNSGAAGIGSAHLTNTNKLQQCGGTVTIYGGTVLALGGASGAGIGGGGYSEGAEVSVYGGTVTATGGGSGAGIGGGYRRSGAKLHIYGGTVTASGGYRGAGIGGGNEGKGGSVTITSGTVIAKAGKESRAIGPGRISALDSPDYGTLTFGDAMMVGAGNDDSVERYYNADERKNACWFRTYAEISPCTHPSGVTYTIEGTDANGTHTSHCKHCGVSETAAHFNSDGTGTCICGYKDGVYCTITIATSIDGAIYEGVGVAAKVGNNMPYTLPVCSSIPEGYDFAGWAVAPTSHNGIRPNGDEELKQAGEDITVTGNISIFARYKPLAISLADGSDNAETLYTYNGKKNASVTLADRTLYKDGGWNTLCLPFNLTIAGSPLDGDGVDVRTLASSSFDESDGTLTLTFTPAEGEGAVTAIEAGKPYIIKWTGGSDIPNPIFSGVTINDSYTPVETDYVDFVGTFSPIDIFTEFKTNLYLGADNLLYYPSGEDMTTFIINSCRAFFQLKEGLTAGELTSTETDQQPIKAFVLNFGEETGISEISTPSNSSNPSNPSNSYFTLDGHRLLDKPTTRGLYIHNGRKVLIK